MYAHVDLEVLFLSEGLGAPGMRAPVRLCPVVQVHVRLQPATAMELFLATFFGANKALQALSPPPLHRLLRKLFISTLAFKVELFKEVGLRIFVFALAKISN